MRYIIIVSMVVVGCSSCSSNRPPAVAVPRVAEPQGPVISRMVGRDEVIVVRAGPNGPTYCLQSKNGEVIVPAMTLGDLAMSKPELFQELRVMQADTLLARR